MPSIRKVDNKNPERHRVLRYLRNHPQELRYIVGDYIAKHGLKVVKNTDPRYKVHKDWDKKITKFKY